MQTYEVINDILVNLFNEILKREEEAIITEEFKDISNNDMHVIEAIGPGEGNNMSAVARKLEITVGSLTTAMNSLVNKKYVVRERSETDRRVVNVRLTEKGKAAFYHHKEFHHRMTEAVIQSLDEGEIPVLLKTLRGLSEFFRNYEQENDVAHACDKTDR